MGHRDNLHSNMKSTLSKGSAAHLAVGLQQGRLRGVPHQKRLRYVHKQRLQPTNSTHTAARGILECMRGPRSANYKDNSQQPYLHSLAMVAHELRPSLEGDILPDGLLLEVEQGGLSQSLRSEQSSRLDLRLPASGELIQVTLSAPGSAPLQLPALQLPR